MGNTGITDRAVKITFDLRQIFPSDDSLSVPLLRLMAATNDARYVLKNTLLLLHKAKTANELDASIINGELLYLFRLLCGHLYEAGIAFRSLELDHSDLLNAAARENSKGKKLLGNVREAYATGSDGAFHISFLAPVRNLVSFHYLAEPLASALKRHNELGDIKGTTIAATRVGLGRHTICDHLATGILQEVIGLSHPDFKRAFDDKMSQVLDLAGDLGQLVDQTLAYVFDQRPTANIEYKWGEISIAEEIGEKR
jgi:hypothetical protein